MKLPRRALLRLAAGAGAGAAALPAMPRVAGAQAYPIRPITAVSGFAAGGPTDVVMRILAERMRITLGQPVIVENAAGVAGSIAVGRVARAAPDGYTLSVGHWSTHVVNGAIYALPYDLLNDLEPVARLPSNPMIVVANKTVPATNLNELVSWVKANQEKITVGTAGPGSGTHVSGIYFQKFTDTRLTFVPYRGTGPALQDLIAGQIDVIVDQATNSFAAGPQWRHQSLCHYGKFPPRLGSRQPDGRRSGASRLLRLHLVWPVGAQGHAECRDRKAQRRRHGCDGRSGRAPALRRARHGNPAAPTANTAGAAVSSQARNREVVAHHQGGQHQRRMITGAPSRADPRIASAGPPRRIALHFIWATARRPRRAPCTSS